MCQSEGKASFLMIQKELFSYHILQRKTLRDIYNQSEEKNENWVDYLRITAEYITPLEVKEAMYLRFKEQDFIEGQEEYSKIKITSKGVLYLRQLYNFYRFAEENKIYIIHLIYRLSYGNASRFLNQDKLFDCIERFSGLWLTSILDAIEELEREGEIGWANEQIHITQRGISKIEESNHYEVINRMNDNESLPRPNRNDIVNSQHIHNYNAPVGSVLHGNNNQSIVNQNIGNTNAETLSLISKLREMFREVPDANEYIDALEIEANSTSPNPILLKTAIGALGLSAQQFANKITDGSADILIQALKQHFLGHS